MKLLLRAVLINIAVLLVISSWATITEGQQPYFNWQFGDEPSSRDELKLTNMEIPKVGISQRTWNIGLLLNLRQTSGLCHKIPRK